MKTNKSKQLFERAQQIMPGGVNSPVRAFAGVGGTPFVVARGEGAYLIDVDGNRYVDYINSWGPLVLGHAHPAVVTALTEQLEYGTSYGASCELEYELAEIIISCMPSIEKIRFVNSGTEACMSALRLARGYTGRNKIVKFSGCYHGHSDQLLTKAGSGIATLGLSGSAGVSNDVTRNTITLPFNDTHAVQCVFAEVPEQIAAIILEPVMGNSGLILPNEDFLASLRRTCDASGSLLIFDEVMTGFRVDPGGAQALYNVKPDLTTIGKVIGGGLPVGAYGGKACIMSQIAPEGPVYQAGTLSGNPLAMRAGLATLHEWLHGDTFETTAGIATTLVQALREASLSHNVPIVAQSLGTMFGLFFTDKQTIDNNADAQACDTERFKRFFHACLERGVYFAPSPFEAGFVSCVHAGEPLDHTIKVVNEVFAII